MTEVVRPFRGVSAEDRRTQRRARLLEAGLEEVGEKGVAKLTMTGVCNRAGLTERYFYESFPNREALLAALFDTFFEEFFTATRTAVRQADSDLLTRARVAVGTFVDIVTNDPRKARLYVEAIGNEAVHERRMEAVRRYAEFTAGQATDEYGRATEKERTRIMLATLIVVGGQADAIANWLGGGIPLSREEYIDESARLIVKATEIARDGT